MMRQTCFTLLRHGETGQHGFRGRTDDALSEQGFKQMRAAVSDISDWQLIITSPLQRCRVFAEEIADTHKIELRIEPRFQELDFGEWEGYTAEQLMLHQSEQLANFWADPYNYPPPGGESMAQFEERIVQAMDEYQVSSFGKHILVITHGGVIRVLVAKRDALVTDALLSISVPHASMHHLAYPVVQHT